MSEGNVFKDNGYVVTTDERFSDEGAKLLTETLFYIATPGYKTWATKLMFFNPDGAGNLLGSTVKIMLFSPGIDTIVSPVESPVFIFDTTIDTTGWNEWVLPTPIALPVYSGIGPIQKFGLALYSESGYYIAANKRNIASGLVGLYSSEADSDENGIPSKQGYFKYGETFPPEGLAGVFNWWNGMDVQVTDVDPNPPISPELNLAIGVDKVDAIYLGETPVNWA